MMRAAFADNFFYIVYFQEPGIADAELNAGWQHINSKMRVSSPSDCSIGAMDSGGVATTFSRRRRAISLRT